MPRQSLSLAQYFRDYRFYAPVFLLSDHLGTPDAGMYEVDIGELASF